MKEYKCKNLILFFIAGLIFVSFSINAISFEITYSDNYAIDTRGIQIDYRSNVLKNSKITNNGILYTLPEIKDHYKITEKGCPELPFKDFIIAVPLDSEPTLNITRLDGDLYQIKSSIPPAPSVSLNKDGSPRYTLVPDDRIYSSNEYYPILPYEINEIGLFRDLRLVRIKLYPYMWNPVTSSLWVNSKINIRIDYHSENLDENSLPDSYLSDPYFDDINKSLILNYSQAITWSKGENEKFLDPDSWNPIGMLKIVIDKAGFYKVYGSDLVDNGFDLSTIDPSKLSIYNLGKQVASKINVSGDSFTENDNIEFFGESIDTRYTGDNVYWLSFNESNPIRISTIDASVVNTGSLIETHYPTIKFEENTGIRLGQPEKDWLGYEQNIPYSDKIDHWYWFRWIIGEQKVDLNLNIPNPANTDYTGSIIVRMLGVTEITTVREHLVRVAVNGEIIDERTWSGQTEYDFIGQIKQSILVNGDNLVEIYFNPGRNNNDTINLNWVEFKVEQNLVAQSDVLFFSYQDLFKKTFKLSGFTEENIRIFDITVPSHPIELENFSVLNIEGNYICGFSYDIIGEAKFIAFTPKGYNQIKSFNLPSEVNLKEADKGADYIMITAPEFSSTLTPLVQRYESQNMRVLVASTDQIYDQFEFGIFTPEGIRNFLRYAYYYYQKPAPAFVLFVGNANFDYRNYRNLKGANAKNYVPPYLFTTEIGETPTDFQYTSVSGNDDVPDMVIGRLPVNSIKQLSAILNKIDQYAKSDISDGWNSNILFSSGKNVLHEETSDKMQEYIPDEYNILKIYLNDYESIAKAQEDLVKKINDGVLIFNYVGHSVVGYLESGFLYSSDVSLFKNLEKLSFWILFDCFNGYFMDPWQPCLASTLVRSQVGGAITCLAHSSTGYPALQLRYAKEFYPFLFENKMQRMGLSVLATNIKLGQYDRSMIDMTNSMVFFGDPALCMRNDFGEDAGLKLDIETDKNEYVSNEMINIDLKLENIGPDVDSADIYALVSWGKDSYFLPEGIFEPVKTGFFIPSGSSYYLDRITFDPVSLPSNTNINILAVIVKSGTTEMLSNIASHSALVNKINN